MKNTENVSNSIANTMIDENSLENSLPKIGSEAFLSPVSIMKSSKQRKSIKIDNDRDQIEQKTYNNI